MIFRLTNKNKTTCPQCHKKKHFCRYVHSASGELLPSEYGRCDNEIKCGYHKKPDKKMYEMYKKTEINQKDKKYKPKTTMQYFNKLVYEACEKQGNYESNVFLQNLIKNVPYQFPADKVYEVARLYRIGTVVKGDYAGACAFPFIDISGNINAVQIKKFDKNNHTIDTNFLHRNLEKWYKVVGKPIPEWLSAYLKNESYVNCLFGEHLLPNHKNKPVCIVEAPKTAIYCTLYFGTEKALWLSCYSLSGLTEERMRVLAGRRVYLFPDMSKDGSAYEKWKAQAAYLESKIPQISIKTMDFLEKIGTPEQKNKGYDIADLLIMQDWRNFAATQKPPQAQQYTNPLKESTDGMYAQLPESHTCTTDAQAEYNKKSEQIQAIKQKLEKTQIQSVVGFMNNSEYVQDHSLPSADYIVSLYDMYADFVRYCQENGKKTCDINEFAEILQKELKIEIEVSVKLKKIPF